MRTSKIFKATTLVASGIIGICVVMDIMHWLKYGYLIANKEFSYYINAWFFVVVAANLAVFPLYIVSLFSKTNLTVNKNISLHI